MADTTSQAEAPEDAGCTFIKGRWFYNDDLYMPVYLSRCTKCGMTKDIGKPARPRCLGAGSAVWSSGEAGGESYTRTSQAEAQAPTTAAQASVLTEEMIERIEADTAELLGRYDVVLPSVVLHALAQAITYRLTAGTPPPAPTPALQDVIAERRRQVLVEGWTPAHDDEHDTGELLTAAVCYAQRRMDETRFGRFEASAPAAWPWDVRWWKPKDRRRDLVRAGALILAEIERLDRASTKGDTP